MAKGRRIQELGKEVEALKKRKDDERAAQKTGKASSNKLKEELAEVHRGKINEASSFNMATVEIMGRYHECLCGVGADTELPADCNAASFMEWLRGEVHALDGHMTLGRDFAAVTTFKAMVYWPLGRWL